MVRDRSFGPVRLIATGTLRLVPTNETLAAAEEQQLRDELAAHRLVFVGGLHRSGTTFLADTLARHPEFSGLTGTGAIKNEGQSLQPVFPWGGRWGGPGRFGFRRRLRLTADTPGADLEGAIQMWRAWRPFWDLSKPNLIEKSPPNIVRLPFFQAAFPNCAFVVIVRHPIPVSLATRKWCRATRFQLVRHWARVHDLFTADLPHLRSVAIVRYEDMVADFGAIWSALVEFLGAGSTAAPATPATGMNDKYFARWAGSGPAARLDHRLIERCFARAAARFGYSFSPPYVTDPPDPVLGGTLLRPA